MSRNRTVNSLSSALNRTLRHRIIVFLISISLVPPLLASQTKDISFKHLSVEEGLSNSTVTAIVQDRFGFMWIGTEDGLNKYDGYSFTVYKHRPQDTASIISSWISSLCVDRTGDLWVGTKNGVDRYDQEHDRFVHYSFFSPGSNGYEGNFVLSIAVDGHDHVWFASIYHGVICYNRDGDSVVQFTQGQSDQGRIACDSILGLMVDRANRVWISYVHKGFSMYDPGRRSFTTYGRDPSDTAGAGRSEIHSFCQDAAGNIWVSFFGDGIGRFDERTGHMLRFTHNPQDNNSLSDQATLRIESDSRGDLWIGTFSHGLDRFDPGRNRFIHYDFEPDNVQSLSSGRVYALYEDHGGAIWVGTFKGGLSVYDPVRSKFIHIHHVPNDPNSMSEQPVRSIWEDQKGGMWVGSDQGGLDRYDSASGKFTHYLHNSGNPGGLAGNSVTAICEDRRGQLWVGIYGGGVDRYDAARNMFVHYRHDSRDARTIGSDNTKALYLDADGELWIGSDENFLNRYDADTRTFVRYQLLDTALGAVEEKEVQGISQSRDGTIWVATFGSGLASVNKKTGFVKHYVPDPRNPQSLSSAALYCVTADPGGNLWVGSFGAGFSRYDREKDNFEHFTEADGLPSNFVKGILADDRGNLWLSTMKGLSRFDPRTRMFRNYDITDGVQGNEFQAGAFHRGRSGKFYFGGVNGLNIFYPDSVKDNPFPPQMAITGFKIFDKPAALERSPSSIKSIDLSYKQDYFAFEFVALNYTVPEKNRCAYMLAGFDKDWIMCGTRRYASYTHLDGGTYVFHVRGCNNDGVWSGNDASVTLVIAPPYWSTWWFRGLTVVIIVGIPLLIYRYRFNKLLELERTRNRIARDLHDEVSATLSGINYFAEAITQETEREKDSLTHKYLSLIRESANSVQDSIADIIWSVNPEFDRWDELFAKLRRFASDLLESKSIQHQIEMPDDLAVSPLTMEMRRNFWLIYKEMVTNTLKHSDCRHVAIRVTLEDRNRLCLTISDDGKGFDPALPTERSGLANIRARTELLHGTVDLTTSPAEGTRWKLLFPVG